MFDPENSMVSGYGWGESEAARRREARAEWEWEHADDEWNDFIDFEYEEEGESDED
jgi:hypothetical protein